MVPEKSYKNQSYMASHEAKPLRILAEFLEPEQRFRACGVDRTILFFGSARARSHADHAAAVARAEAAAADPAAPAEERRRQAAALDRLRRSAWMCDVYEDVAALARRLTEWSMGRIATGVSDGVAGGEGGDGGAGAAARPHGVSSWPPNYVVCTGGGPGLMEAANRGAAEVPGAITAGVAISLPFEAGLNKYVTPELAFTQHYFFSRKHALCYPARALVACPGGFGTADELFEVLTLLQSGKSAWRRRAGGRAGGEGEGRCITCVLIPTTRRPPPTPTPQPPRCAPQSRTPTRCRWCCLVGSTGATRSTGPRCSSLASSRRATLTGCSLPTAWTPRSTTS